MNDSNFMGKTSEQWTGLGLIVGIAAFLVAIVLSLLLRSADPMFVVLFAVMGVFFLVCMGNLIAIGWEMWRDDEC